VLQNRPKAEEPQPSAQILRFRPRAHSPAYTPLRPLDNVAPIENEPADPLARYEEEDAHIDYRHRMVMNVIAVTIVATLIGLGVWLADTIAEMQKIQDCMLQGRQNCAPIQLAPPNHNN
jgi:hypothetical protein